MSSPSSPTPNTAGTALVLDVDVLTGVSGSVHRAAMNELGTAVSTVADPESPELALRALERVLALNRLVRGSVGRRAYREEGAVLRHCVKHLGPGCSWLRLVATLEDLADHYHGTLSADAFGVTRSWLDTQCTETWAARSGQAAIDLRMTVGAARGRYEAWDPEQRGPRKRSARPVEDDLGPVIDELAHTYDRGRRSLARAYDGGRTRDFRRWHRRVRRLADQLVLVEGLDPALVGAHRSLLDRLDGLLQSHDDLARLGQVVRGEPAAIADERERTLLVVLIERARVELQWEARPLGRRAFAEEADAFAARLRAYWQAGLGTD
ncbi:MAG: hypothetical protein GY929_09465 [Actinomycetia bacterium]|nr:hypothetical protein [Actinomycetes bacterium]